MLQLTVFTPFQLTVVHSNEILLSDHVPTGHVHECDLGRFLVLFWEPVRQHATAARSPAEISDVRNVERLLIQQLHAVRSEHAYTVRGLT